MSFHFGGTSGDILADRRYDMALGLAENGELQAAADLLADSLAHAPSWPPIHFHLGDMYRRLGRVADAESALRRYLALDPADHMGAGVKLSLMGLATPGAAMSAAYVQSLFDQYAPYFESALVGKLEYKTPQLLADAILSAAGTGGRFSRALDLGCGTGLAVEALHGHIDTADGIDIAPAMVAQARTKNLYAHLETAEIADFLSRTKDSAYDLVLAADVFVYIGPLEDIFGGIARTLSSGGLFAFSVQSADETGAPWVLGEDHRYAHTLSYLNACTAASGLLPVSVTPCTLRQDAGRPVSGHLLVLRNG